MRLTPRDAHPEGRFSGLLGVDIVDFTGRQRNDDIRAYLRKELHTMLRAGFDGSGLGWHDCVYEDRGDGGLIVIPPGMPLARVIDPLPERLRGLIRRHNQVFRDAAGMQLRAAFHIGPTFRDEQGYVGTDVNIMFRLLEASALKREIASSGAEFGLIVSPYVYETFVRRNPGLVDPAAFKPVRVRVKSTNTRGWIYLPGHAPGGGGGTTLRLPAGAAP